jgi:hypothetical protein
MDVPEDRASDPARRYITQRFDKTDPVHVGMLSHQDTDVIIGSKGKLHIPSSNGQPLEAGKAYGKEDLPQLKEEVSAKKVKNIQNPGAALEREKADAIRNAHHRARKAAEGKK